MSLPPAQFRALREDQLADELARASAVSAATSAPNAAPLKPDSFALSDGDDDGSAGRLYDRMSDKERRALNLKNQAEIDQKRNKKKQRDLHWKINNDMKNENNKQFLRNEYTNNNKKKMQKTNNNKKMCAMQRVESS